MNLYFTYESRDTLKSFTLFITVKAITKLNLGHRNKFEIEFQKNSCCSSRSSDNAELVISRCCFVEDGKEMYKKLCNARAEPLFCSLNLLFSDVPVAVAVAVVVILNSLLKTAELPALCDVVAKFDLSTICSSFRHVHIHVYLFTTSFK